MKMNKEQTLFYLTRLLKGFEAEKFDHVAAAEKCVSYAERRRLIASSNQPVGEVYALRTAINILGNTNDVAFEQEQEIDEEAKVV